MCPEARPVSVKVAFVSLEDAWCPGYEDALLIYGWPATLPI
jgi:hypothetical protein